MNAVNKKFDRLRQWGKEKMGGDSSGTTDDFKALEMEMNLRHEGMEKLHGSMNVYVKSISKRTEGDSKEKATPVAYLGSIMAKHGEAFEEGNKFGECLINFGQANERIARMQDAYATNATSSWLDALERSLAQMRDYQNARKKLENRRLAYDTSLTKMQKARKDDYKAEEELRSQKAKYEESTEDVYRRMQDIIDSENDNATDLYSFLEAELNYHDRAREVLLQLKREWPLADTLPNSRNRSRSNTLDRFRSNISVESEDIPLPPALPFRSSRTNSGTSSPSRELPGFEFSGSPSRPMITRMTTGDTLNRTRPTAPEQPSFRIPQQQQLQIQTARRRGISNAENVFGDPAGDEVSSSSPDKFWDGSLERSSSPATSGTAISRNTSWSALDAAAKNAAGNHGEGGGHGFNNGVGLVGMTKKAAPPPPPPSRSSKPKPPPPPPLKRSALSTTTVPYAV